MAEKRDKEQNSSVSFEEKSQYFDYKYDLIVNVVNNNCILFNNTTNMMQDKQYIVQNKQKNSTCQYCIYRDENHQNIKGSGILPSQGLLSSLGNRTSFLKD